jgi:hypothetical protein
MKLPTELLGMMLLISIFLLGFSGFFGAMAGAYGVAVDDLSFLNKTTEVYGFAEDYYDQFNSSMTENPTSSETNFVVEVVSFIATSASTVGYMFISLPVMFTDLISHGLLAFPFMPSWVAPALSFFILLSLIGWLIYLGTKTKA